MPGPEWVHEVCRDLEAGTREALIAKATEDRKPDFLIKQMENGHAYAGWRWS